MASTGSDHGVRTAREHLHTRPGRASTPAHGAEPVADVDAALRTLQSHGLSNGWTGRRDRALLVLTQMAGLRADTIVELTAGDIAISDGVATISTPGGTTTLRRHDDVLVCGPCALARWLRALDLTAVQPTHVAASVIARALPLTAGSPHLCAGELILAPATRGMPVLPQTDCWGPHRTSTSSPGAGPSAATKSGHRRAHRRSAGEHPTGFEAQSPPQDTTTPKGTVTITGNPGPTRVPLQRSTNEGSANEGSANKPSANKPSTNEIGTNRRNASKRGPGAGPTNDRGTGDLRPAEIAPARTGTLRLSNYPVPMEPGTAQRLRRHLDRTAGELSASQRGN